jgi:WD40 repeat protein
MVLSPDGHILAVGEGTGKVGLWDVAKRKQLGQLPTGFIFSGESNEDGESNGEGESNEDGVSEDCTDKLVFSPDGRTLVSVSGNPNEATGEVRFWDVASHKQLGQLSGYAGYSELAEGVVFSPDGHTIASIYEDEVRIWDVKTFRELDRLSAQARVTDLALSPDGRTVALVTEAVPGEPSEGNNVLLLDLTTHKQLGRLPIGPDESVNGIVFSPDGHTLLSIDGEPGEPEGSKLILWNVATRKQLGQSLIDPGEAATTAIFSPNGLTLAIAGENGGIHLWRGILWQRFSELRNKVCDLVGDDLSRAEWAEYAPGVSYRQIC